MSEAVQIAAFLLVAGAIATLARLLWSHVDHCKSVHSKLAEIGSDVKRIQQDIGDHDKGMRRDIREHTSALFKLDARIETLERASEDER